MNSRIADSNYDCIVVGTGPGGATLARELARGGKKVLILERGRTVPVRTPLRDILSTARIAHLGRGATLVSGAAVGGTTMLYYGTAHEPPYRRFLDLGIDLGEAFEEVAHLIPTAPLRDDLIGPMAGAIGKSALDLGLDWKKLPKHIDQDALGPGRTGEVVAKRWTAGNFVREAVAQGAVLVERAAVGKVLIEKGRAAGVEYRHKGEARRAFAPKVLVAAGGIGSPRILAGSLERDLKAGFFCDPVIMAFGEVDHIDGGSEPPMAFGTRLEEEGVLLADLTLPKSLYVAGALQALRPDRLFCHRRTLGVMVKAADSVGGSLKPLGKSFLEEDLQKLQKGVRVARKILENAGAKKIFTSRISSAHPGGSLSIGVHTDSNLKTRIEGLYVCDASVIPGPWGLPPTTTIVCLAMRLASHLLSGG